MTADVLGDPTRDGRSFIPSVVGHPAFCSVGVAYGRAPGGARWAVVDPQRHPLTLWGRPARAGWAYGRTAGGLDAVLFTNGPMMGKRLPGGRKLTMSRVPIDFALWTIAGAVAGGRLAGAPRSALGRVSGAVAGVVLVWGRTFTGWEPCGRVHGTAAGIEDSRDFDHEGQRHAWFGRNGRDFASYRIDNGDLPAGVEEGMGGLILLVKDHRVVDRRPDEPGYRRDFAELATKKGVVAWGLVPIDAGSGTGVLVVLGGRRLDAAGVAAAMKSIGARDAVATDQSGSILMGAGRTFLLRRPALPRQCMQVYGLSCR